jgi:molybdate transport system regulatory protein
MIDLRVDMSNDGQVVTPGRIDTRVRLSIESHPTRPAGGLQTARRNIIAARLRTKIWLEHEGQFVIGDGGFQLLMAIVEHGSLRAAAGAIGWSYRHAWGYLRRAEVVLGTRLTVSRAGRGHGRGTSLTDSGRLLMERVAAARMRIDELVERSGPTPEEVAARGQNQEQRASRSRGGRTKRVEPRELPQRVEREPGGEKGPYARRRPKAGREA